MVRRHVSFNQSTDTFTITAMGHDSGSLTITAVSASTQLVKTMSLAKSTAGSDGFAGAQGSTGLDGSSAKSLVASVSSQVFYLMIQVIQRQRQEILYSHLINKT